MKIRKLVTGIVEIFVFGVVALFLSGLGLVIAFGAETRPGWASIALLGIMIVVPLGVALSLLLRAVDSLTAGKIATSWALLGGVLLCPVAGWAIGMGLLSTRVIP